MTDISMFIVGLGMGFMFGFRLAVYLIGNILSV